MRSPIGSPPVLDGQVGLERVDVAVPEHRCKPARCPPGRRGAGPWSGGAAGCCGTAGSRAAAASRHPDARSPAATRDLVADLAPGVDVAASGRRDPAAGRRRIVSVTPRAVSRFRERCDTGLPLGGRDAPWPATARRPAPPSPAAAAGAARRLRRAAPPAHPDRAGPAGRAAAPHGAPAGRRAGRLGRAVRTSDGGVRRRPPALGPRAAGAGADRSAAGRLAVPARPVRRDPGHRAPRRARRAPRCSTSTGSPATRRCPWSAHRVAAAAARHRRRQGAAGARARRTCRPRCWRA